nr:MAG TPA: hypothetical protein [Bacteriophage sp.]
MRVRLFILANACRLLYRALEAYRKRPKNNHAYDINSK